MTHETITRAKDVMRLVEAGWELWHISESPLPGAWELRQGRRRQSVHWDAIESLRRHCRTWMEANLIDSPEGRFTWCYRFRQAALGTIFPSELTEVGDQLLVPGCEKLATPGKSAPQPDLWEAAGKAGR